MKGLERNGLKFEILENLIAFILIILHVESNICFWAYFFHYSNNLFIFHFLV
jgi:hypothetical protein